jgi:D-arabinitol 2-dehydrogenase
MFRQPLFRQSASLLRSSRSQSATPLRAASKNSSIRVLSTSPRVLNKHEGLPGNNDEHEGAMARTDKEVIIEHPPEKELPRSIPYQGRGGIHDKRTLASFSLEDRVAVVTGGARGLGLIMAQALVISGANVALVDLNSILYFSSSM